MYYSVFKLKMALCCFQNKEFTDICILSCIYIFLFLMLSVTWHKTSFESEVIQCSQNNRNYSVELDNFSDKGAGSW